MNLGRHLAGQLQLGTLRLNFLFSHNKIRLPDRQLHSNIQVEHLQGRQRWLLVQCCRLLPKSPNLICALHTAYLADKVTREPGLLVLNIQLAKLVHDMSSMATTRQIASVNIELLLCMLSSALHVLRMFCFTNITIMFENVSNMSLMSLENN